MDGENNGKTLMNKWMIWGYHYFRKHPYIETKNGPAFLFPGMADMLFTDYVGDTLKIAILLL